MRLLYLFIVGLILFYTTSRLCIQYSFGLTIHLPYTPEEDLVAPQDIITKQDSKDSFLNLIRFINSYLRFFLAAVCFAVLIYAGFEMITGRGDESTFKAGIMTAVYAGIGIGVALMAYAAVNIVVNIMGSG